MTVGTTVRLYTAKLLIDQTKLSTFGNVYGDDQEETGIQLFKLTNAASRTTYLGSTTGTGQGTTTKYAIAAASSVAPDAVPDEFSMDEDGFLSVSGPGVLANDTDPNSLALQAYPSAGPLHASSFSLSPNGSFTYVPAANFVGTDTFTYYVRNTVGVVSLEAAVTITINPVNDPPVIQPPANTTIDEEKQGSLQFTASDLYDNPPNNPITIELVSGPPGTSMSSSGVLTWTPTEAQGPETYPVTIRATDSGTPKLSSTMTYNVTVREVNKAPVVATIPSQTIDELREVKATATATDADLPAQALKFGLRNAPAGMTMNQDTGVLKWIPSEVQGPAIHLFYVTATDGVDTSETPVTYTVKEVNSAPELQPIDDILTVGEEVVEFDCKVKDPDIPQNVFVFFLEGAPAGATLSVFDGHFRWIPPTVTTAQDYYFKIKVIDNGIPNMTSEQTVRITVVPTGTQSPIEGKITLQDFKISSEGQKVDFEVRNSLGVLLEVIPNISLGAGGSYSIMSNQTGTVSLSVRGLTWLTAARYPVTLGSAVAKVGFSLINGDVDGDDYVGTDDYIRLGLAFDSSVGDGNYDRNADLDGDGYVGTDDYLILNKNFDQQGM
ncbi:MAG: cadherin-like domain-containing protein [Chthonomonas sp.]|nr:cadherin-like domain-containing protein [Chthonomonas sp.]